jgi:hypothetical protein
VTSDQGMGSGLGSGGVPPPGQPPLYGPPSYGPPSYGPPSYGPSPRGQAPYGQVSYGQPGMLASTADRDRVIDVLKAAYGEGRLTKDEFDTRCAQVMAARRYGDLAPIIADLPGGGAFTAPYPQSGYYTVMRAPSNGLAAGSLVSSLIGLLIPPATVPAVILGHVSRSQIRRTGQRGDGIALAGLIIGYLGLAFWTLILVVAIAAATHG